MPSRYEDRDPGLFMGLAEIADLLGVSRQRIYKMRMAKKLPPPISVLSCGPIWWADDITDWIKGGRKSA